MVVSLKKMEFVTSMPNGESTKAIKAEYDLLSSHSHVAAQMTVYYEIVQLRAGQRRRRTPGACWRQSATFALK